MASLASKNAFSEVGDGAPAPKNVDYFQGEVMIDVARGHSFCSRWLPFVGDGGNGRLCCSLGPSRECATNYK